MERKVRWQEKEARKTRALRVARMEATMIWSGMNPLSTENVRRLALAYRAKQAVPEATYRRRRRSYREIKSSRIALIWQINSATSI